MHVMVEDVKKNLMTQGTEKNSKALISKSYCRWWDTGPGQKLQNCESIPPFDWRRIYVFGPIFEPLEMLLYCLQLARSSLFSKWGSYDFNWWSKILRSINHTDNKPATWNQKTHFRHDGRFEKAWCLLVKKSMQQTNMETLSLQCGYY